MKKKPFFVPTAFSPNGDYINDRFTVYVNTYQVEEITNCSGCSTGGAVCCSNGKIAPNDDSSGWDGTAKRATAQPGVYTYMVEVKLINGTYQSGGHVVLMRVRGVGRLGCLDVWMFGCLDVWMFGCLDVWGVGRLGDWLKAVCFPT